MQQSDGNVKPLKEKCLNYIPLKKLHHITEFASTIEHSNISEINKLSQSHGHKLCQK